MNPVSSIVKACGAALALLSLTLAGAAAAQTTPHPILFVTQVPTLGDFAGRGSTFANHMTRPAQVVRGGDLMIRYPNGTLRNLTQEAGFGMSGLQQGNNAIAVREPTVHWDGTKAVFSMVKGAPPQFSHSLFQWQLYEVTGLGQGQTAVITKVPNQPTGYNNVSPIYASDDRIIFTSDRPHNGEAHLYPQLDEYESTPTVTGLWSLNPTTGELKLMNHTPSGAFSPSIDSFGRVIFTRWDHLQRDQQFDAGTFGAVTFLNESAVSFPGPPAPLEMFPEPRGDSVSPTYGAINGLRFNQFTPWQMNQDGTDEETLNHVGRHEISQGYLIKSFAADSALSDYTVGFNNPPARLSPNTITVGMDTGLFHLRESPTQPGKYFTTFTREFETLSSGQLLSINGGPNVNPNAIVLTKETATIEGAYNGGRFRNPLPLSDGALIASHTLTSGMTPSTMTDFRLKVLNRNASTNFYEAGATLTNGIVKSVSWWTPDNQQSFNGPLWELEAVEVKARTRPAAPTLAIDTPEAQVFAEEGVNETTFRDWLKTNNYALIVTRNHTSRDLGDELQPFNLRVPGGVQSVKPGGGRVYDIQHFQILQGDLVRGYTSREGRRPIARILHDSGTENVPNPTGPAGSVKIAPDGSSAAIVPARRALAWQTTDPAGEPIVRERVWVTFQPGEVRVCASCHGANTVNQVNQGTPTNKPQALRDLLTYWKQSLAPAPAVRNDFNDDSRADILLRNTNTGENYLYPMNGTGVLATEGYIRTVPAPWTLAGIGDFDGNGTADLLWRNSATGENYVYFMNGTTIANEGYIRTVPLAWSVAGVADFDGDGKADILLRNTSTGENYLYPMDGLTIKAAEGYIRTVPSPWTIAGLADFNGDGRADILLRNTTTGENYLYPMNGTAIQAGEGYIRTVPLVWSVAGLGDFDGDGKADILLRNTNTGENYLYPMDGTAIKATEGYIRTVPLEWAVASVSDFDGDGKVDILLRNTGTGENYLYPMDGKTIKPTEGYVRTVPLAWSVVSK
jgi:hypothetical protein